MQYEAVSFGRGAVDAAEGAFWRWGLVSAAGLWPTPLRILFVLDGRISTTEDQTFGLAWVLDTLTEAFAWWVRLDVHVVRRDQGQRRLAPPSPDYPEETGFRFTDAAFDLDQYDQVWFFGDYPANETPTAQEPMRGNPAYSAYSPLEPSELKLLADWMDRGGGVFAAGDHFNLGASMCSRIPRVRTMRRWTVEQGVPPQFGPERHQTLQEVPQGTVHPLPDNWERDAYPQPIWPVYRIRTTSVLNRPFFPHALLDLPGGKIVVWFPDHMHEGDVVPDDQVELDLPLDIPGYNRPEYPFEGTEVEPAAVGAGGGSLRPRPRPHVVAYGQTTNLPGENYGGEPPQNLPEALANVEEAARPLNLLARRFGLVGAYDGDSVGIGRVVVDSTWHHWFNLNLAGFKDPVTPVYEAMQAYYRNVALWLATPTQRRLMLYAAVWGVVASDPMAFSDSSDRSIWAIGERVFGVIARTASRGMLLDCIGAFFGGRADELFDAPNSIDSFAPFAGTVPVELAIRAIIGGVGSALLAPALEYHAARDPERRLLNAEAIAQHAASGVKQGQRALLDALRASATETIETARRVSERFEPPTLDQVPIETVRVRVVAERLQLPDPTDPALIDGLHAMIRISLADTVVAVEQLDERELPAFDPRGVFLTLDRIVYEGPAQSGEALVVEVIAAEPTSSAAASGQIRFSDARQGVPSTWIGARRPDPGQTWRLWYRVDRSSPR